MSERVTEEISRFSTPNKIFGRVLLVEDDDLLGQWLCQGLARNHIETYWAKAPQHAKQFLEQNTVIFHAVICDIYFDETQPQGLEFIRTLETNRLPAFVITSRLSLEVAMEAIDHSICAVLEKPFELEDLIQKLKNAWQEPQYLSTILERVMELNHLTSKEREVCRLLVKGLSNKEIAAVLGVTEKTIKFHLTSTFEKFRVKSRAELLSSIFPT